ncbi:multidrug resistance-associated protein 9-like [Neolamprologus brichardi]|uniref:multidrug resistance-associated protein 9-like n=1 Tax=Neolamprologus brichardi TaxID=32507 RepID=UPI0016436CE0|nr:multidrug resistance-associated protein 9-like [Neolamprologus brichardi]
MQGDISQNPQLRFFQLVYGMTVIITALFATIKAFVYTNVTLNASCKLHDTMYKKIIDSPMSFFDMTPSGQILNRFSKDQEDVDAEIPPPRGCFLAVFSTHPVHHNEHCGCLSNPDGSCGYNGSPVYPAPLVRLVLV